MITANQLKNIALLVGVALLQIGLFAFYVADLWHSPLSLLLIVAVPLTLFVVAYRRERNWLNTACNVTGHIINHQAKLVWAKQTEVLTVAYVLYGTTYTYYSYRSPLSKLPSVGESIDLLYNPNKPDEAMERSIWWQKLIGLSILVLNAISLVFVALYVFQAPFVGCSLPSLP